MRKKLCETCKDLEGCQRLERKDLSGCAKHEPDEDRKFTTREVEEIAWRVEQKARTPVIKGVTPEIAKETIWDVDNIYPRPLTERQKETLSRWGIEQTEAHEEQAKEEDQQAGDDPLKHGTGAEPFSGLQDVDRESLKAAESVEQKLRESVEEKMREKELPEGEIMWGDVTGVRELVGAIDTKNRWEDFEKEFSEGRKSICLNCGKPISLTEGKKKKTFCNNTCGRAYGRRKNKE